MDSETRKAITSAPPSVHPRAVEFFVPGTPMTKGDHTAQTIGSKTFIREKNAGAKKRWRDHAAVLAREARGEMPPYDEPIRVKLVVLTMRPQSHYGSGKNAGVLRATAPAMPMSKPDLDKIARSLGDALNGVLWRDDARISTWLIMRRWATESGIAVFVQPEAAS